MDNFEVPLCSSHIHLYLENSRTKTLFEIFRYFCIVNIKIDKMNTRYWNIFSQLKVTNSGKS